ncbi:hypothetical protein M5689_024723 [Euphorbia peplus]|nr:hypothetical protein M5689_024723 [Euphorbia peplus]
MQWVEQKYVAAHPRAAGKYLKRKKKKKGQRERKRPASRRPERLREREREIQSSFSELPNIITKIHRQNRIALLDLSDSLSHLIYYVT